ncbi:hypothetical protein [Pseudomonas fluorescens]|uniref:hypothetical protein n=1 Tax=Pseudomonas fluorescens TaxID=294 RepID=UPI00123EE5FE
MGNRALKLSLGALVLSGFHLSCNADELDKDGLMQVVEATFSAAGSCHNRSRLFGKVLQAKSDGASLAQINTAIDAALLEANKDVIDAAYSYGGPLDEGAEKYFDKCISDRRSDMKRMIFR